MQLYAHAHALVNTFHASTYFTGQLSTGYPFGMADHLAIVRGLLIVFGDKQDVLARELGVSQPTVSRWLAGGKIKTENRDRLMELAEEKGLVNHDPFGRGKTSREVVMDRIPEIDLTAGLGGGGVATVKSTSNKHGIVFSKEAIRDHWRLPDWIMGRMHARAEHIAAFPVQGDSMEPTLNDGDVIFVDTRHRQPSPDGIYALADEFGGVVVKRLEVTSRPGDDIVNVSIISDNPRHRTRDLTLPEIYIIGRYVGRFTT